MASQIYPIHEAPRDRVLAYLGERGVDAALAEWKYFDASFNRDRDRGLVWLRDGEIRAFLGLIPCTVTDGTRSWPMTWTCDWSVADRKVDGALGVLLVKKATAVAPWLLAFGGNDTTQALLPKVAAATIEGAGVTYRLSLRLGTITRRLERRVPLLARRRVAHLHRIPIRRIPRHAHGVTCVPGIAPAIEAVTATPPMGALIPRYDAQYLSWQLGRCPDVECWTLLSADEGAGAVVWRARHSTVDWRMAQWSRTPSSRGPLDTVVRAASRLAYDGGGEVVSTVVSRLDRGAIDSLEAVGFERVGPTRPLFVCGRPAEVPGALELAGLSYLATDLSYRFSTASPRSLAADGRPS